MIDREDRVRPRRGAITVTAFAAGIALLGGALAFGAQPHVHAADSDDSDSGTANADPSATATATHTPTPGPPSNGSSQVIDGVLYYYDDGAWFDSRIWGPPSSWNPDAPPSSFLGPGSGGDNPMTVNAQ
jgi:hypothetical protein